MAFFTNLVSAPLAILLEEAPVQPQGSLFDMALPFMAILGVFYFLLIRPESKRRKEHEAVIAGISKGDTILTNGGIVGTVVLTKENLVSVQVAKGVNMMVVRSAIQGIVDPHTGLSAGAADSSSAKDKDKDSEKDED